MKTKKELKEEYKQIKPRLGVFQLRNKVNGKIYVEGSTSLGSIWNRHRVELNFGNHRNEALQKEWKEYGEENFAFEILAEIEHRDDPAFDYRREVKALEEMYLDELQPFDNKGYNRRKVSVGVT